MFYRLYSLLSNFPSWSMGIVPAGLLQADALNTRRGTYADQSKPYCCITRDLARSVVLQSSTFYLTFRECQFVSLFCIWI